MRLSHSARYFHEGYPLETYNFDPVLTSGIQLPDGSQYSFLYNQYGELARLTSPGGGAYEYDYGDGNNASSNGFEGSTSDLNAVMIYRRLQERREYASGGTSATSRTHYSVAYAGATTVDTDITYAPGSTTPLTQVVHTMNGSPLDALNTTAAGCNAWNEGLEVQTDTGYPALNRVQTNYVAQTGCLNNPQVASKTTTLLDTNQVSQSTYAYDLYNNIIDQKDYDWGAGAAGAIRRETSTTYLWANNAAVYGRQGINVVHAPFYQFICSGSQSGACGTNNNETAQTVWHYDEAAPSDAPGILNHDSTYGTSYTTRANLTSTYKWQKTTGAFLGTGISYDIAGNVLVVTDPNNHSSSFTYNDDSSNHYAFPTKTVNALSQSQTAGYDYNIGKPSYTTDLNGNQTTYAYSDGLDRLTSVTNPDGGHQSYSYPTTTEVDAYQDQDSAHTGTNGLHTQTLYDGLGRSIESRTYESTSGYISTTESYNAMGLVSQTTNPSRPGDSLGYATQYSYDSLGRVFSVLTPDSAVATTSHSGNTTLGTDQVGHKRSQVTDALGRLTDVYEDPSGSNFHTNYGFDVLGNLLTVQQGTQTRTFSYDSLSRLVSATNPESGTVSYTYDNAGNLKTKVYPAPSNTTYTKTWNYDALNRVQGIGYTDPSMSPVGYTYDTAGITNSIGQLTQVSYGWISSYTAFDKMGRVTQSSEYSGYGNYPFAYSYNLAGALTSETYPSGRVITTAYDGANRPLSVKGQSGTSQTSYVSSVSYQPQGAPSKVSYGNNVVRTWSYNSRLQPSAWWDAVGDSSSNYLLMENPIQWATNGNLSSRSIYAGGPAPMASLTHFSQTFGYDTLNRLTSASETGGWSQTYSYDQYGNMWMPSVTGLPANGAMPVSNVYNGKNQNPNSAFDLVGNQTTFGALTLTYDAENRMVGAANTLGGGNESYEYDAFSRRVRKLSASGFTFYIYDAFGQLAVEYNNFTPPALPCGICYMSVDHLGSTRMVTNESGLVVSRHDFAPFGQEVPSGVAGRTTLWAATDNINQKFTGQERDTESGLDFFQARYMANSLGRFMSPDLPRVDQNPSDPQSWNLYSYVRNNPLANVDPNGTDCITFDNGLKGLDPDQPQGGCGSLDQNGNDSQPQQVNVNSDGNVTWGNDDPLSPFASAVLGGAYQSGGFITKPGFWAGYAGASIVGGGAVAGGLAITSGAGLSTIAGAGPILLQPNLGTKLNYLFGLATGSNYNIQRSTAMLSELQQVGLNDTEEVRQVVTQNLAQALNNPSSVIAQTGDTTVRESLLMGPNGAVKLESIWQGTQLITVKVFGGK